MNQIIENIIFDLGGVLLNIDYQKTVESFADKGISNFDKVFNQFYQDDVSKQFEQGLIDERAFREYIRSISNSNITDTEIDEAWNAMLLDFPLERYNMLCNLQKKYRLFLLSNTNSIHYRAFQNIVAESLPVTSLDVLFDKAYYSHLISLRKPDIEIFQFVLKEQGIDPHKSLFIDDSPQHIAAAKRLNLATILLDKGDEVNEILKINGLW